MNVLLSIKPKYVKEILKGEKKYEFRRSIFQYREEIEMVYIYSTSPVKRIVGRFTIEEIIEGHPKNLWESFRDFSGIEDEEFFRYFGAAEKRFAIKIEKVEVFKEPIDPKISIPDFVPPQSFRYFKETEIGFVPEDWKVEELERENMKVVEGTYDVLVVVDNTLEQSSV